EPPLDLLRIAGGRRGSVRRGHGAGAHVGDRVAQRADDAPARMARQEAFEGLGREQPVHRRNRAARVAHRPAPGTLSAAGGGTESGGTVSGGAAFPGGGAGSRSGGARRSVVSPPPSGTPLMFTTPP